MKQEALNKDITTENTVYVSTGDNGLRLSNIRAQKFKSTKLTFTDEYIETLTADERFINSLMENNHFIKNIKAILGGTK